MLEEQQRRIQEAMTSKPAPPEDNFEMKAMKFMGEMVEGDAVLGTGSEVNLDSQVLHLVHSLLLHFIYFFPRLYSRKNEIVVGHISQIFMQNLMK